MELRYYSLAPLVRVTTQSTAFAAVSRLLRSVNSAIKKRGPKWDSKVVARPQKEEGVMEAMAEATADAMAGEQPDASAKRWHNTATNPNLPHLARLVDLRTRSNARPPHSLPSRRSASTPQPRLLWSALEAVHRRSNRRGGQVSDLSVVPHQS